MFFKKKKINFESDSLSVITWKRFKRDKLAMLGLLVIFATCLISILGYTICPDPTPFANDQKPELNIKSPGFVAKFLKVNKNEKPVETSFFKEMFLGKTYDFNTYTVYNYFFKGDMILVEEYTGNTENAEKNNGNFSKFNIADVVYHLNPNIKPSYDTVKGTITFTDYKNEVFTKSIIELRNQIATEHLTQRKYYLGTDKLGRDLLSRLLIGTRISLGVGLVSVLISVVIGILLGALAGFYRGKVDAAIMWLINVVWSLPTLLLVIAITLILGKGIVQVFIAVGLTMWVEVARIVRGQILSIREKEFVEAGRALGFKSMRVILHHILPNVMGPVVVMAASNFASAILTEAGLSYLGIGAQPPVPSWGEMTSTHHGYILMDKAYLAFIPGIAIMILVLAFMLVGNGLRDALDTRSMDDKPIAST